MTAFVMTADGKSSALPAALQWEFNYTTGVPCDSFAYRCFWDNGGDDTPKNWVRFQAVEGDDIVFSGVIDECETSISASGSLLEVSGRGMAALLLDNEALGEDYETATVNDILRDHVSKYGISVTECADLPAVSHFSVASGSSEWSVLYEFCCYYGGISPRFNQSGQLLLSEWKDDRSILIGDATPVTKLLCRDRRYGVLSEIQVRDRVRKVVETVENDAFKSVGGRASRVMTMPGRSDYQTMRYSGGYQLKKSMQELLRLEVEIAHPFFAKPGDLVSLSRSNWGRNGLYRVLEARVGQGDKGCWTGLELAPTDIMV